MQYMRDDKNFPKATMLTKSKMLQLLYEIKASSLLLSLLHSLILSDLCEHFK